MGDTAQYVWGHREQGQPRGGHSDFAGSPSALRTLRWGEVGLGLIVWPWLLQPQTHPLCLQPCYS